MTVFKTFWKILNKNKVIVIFYTIMLLIFGGLNMQNSDINMSFVASKPDILIINNDKEEGITKDLIKYLTNNSNIVEVEKDEESINDALFYRDVNYVIYIPENYHNDFMNGSNPEIEIKSTGDYQASFEEMIISRYIKVASIYRNSIENEEELITKINETLSKESKVEITSKLDTTTLSKATFYYNFASYAIIYCLMFIIGLMLFSFNEEKVKKRINISSTNHKKHNLMLLLSNCCYSLLLWLFYVILSFALIGKSMFSMHGVIYIVNSCVLSICATTMAFLVGNLVPNKNALGGIVNVISLGSSFLCGAFVPMEWLPDSVLKIAHAIPTYYYISNNEIVKTLEDFNYETLKPIIQNMAIMLVFSIVFIVLANIVSKKKSRK